MPSSLFRTSLVAAISVPSLAMSAPSLAEEVAGDFLQPLVIESNSLDFSGSINVRNNTLGECLLAGSGAGDNYTCLKNVGVYTKNPTGLKLNNKGKIEAFSSGPYESVDGVHTGNGVARGVYSSQQGLSVKNTGTIKGVSTASGGYGYGVYGYSTADVENYGEIFAAGWKPRGVYGHGAFTGDTILTLWGISNLPPVKNAPHHGVAKVYNEGLIKTVANQPSLSEFSTGSAYGVVGFEVDVTNHGEITAISKVKESYPYAVFSMGNGKINNSGTLKAVNQAGGNNAYAVSLWNLFLSDDSTSVGYVPTKDYLNLYPGSHIIGGLDLGGGEDEITFKGGHHNLTFSSSFYLATEEALEGIKNADFSNSDIPWVRSGQQVAAYDPTIFAGQAWLLQSMTREISSLKSPSSVWSIDGDQSVVTQQENKDYRVWIKGFGGKRDENDSSYTLSYNNQFGGFALGVERKFEHDLLIQGFGGAVWGSTNLSHDYGDSDMDLGFFGLSVSKGWGDFNINAALQSGTGDLDVNRKINNNLDPSGWDKGTGSSDLWYISPELEIGYNFSLYSDKNVQVGLSPVAKMRYMYADMGGYTEKGANDKFKVKSFGFDTFEDTYTLLLSYVSGGSRSDDFMITFNLEGGLQGSHLLGSDHVDASLLGKSVEFDVPGSSNEYGLLVGGALELRKKNISVNLAVRNIAYSDFGNDLSLSGGVQYRF